MSEPDLWPTSDAEPFADAPERDRCQWCDRRTCPGVDGGACADEGGHA